MTKRDAQRAVSNTSQPAIDSGMPPADLQEQDFASALLSVGAVADRALVCRTQRRVREQATEIAEQRQRVRHAVGLAILGFSLLLLVLTPVIWSSFHLASDRSFTDFESQSLYVIGWLFPVTLIGLILAFLRMRAGRGSRRIDHRMDSRLGSMVR